MTLSLLYSLWNGGLMDLSKTYKIDCLKKVNALILRAVLARCDDDSRIYWHKIFEMFEELIVKMVEKNPEGRRHLQFVVDREILCIVHKINEIQNHEEKHYKYLEQRKERKPLYNNDHSKHKKHKKHCSRDEDDCDDDDDECD